MAQQIVEGNLIFEFPDNWLVSKYDDWTFYRKHFQQQLQGQKAVDIIAIEPKNQCLWMIEVKDYRANRRTKPCDLINEVVVKIIDSLSGLWAAKINATIPAERELAIAAAKCKQLRVILHLEQPQKYSKLFPKVIDPANASVRLRKLMRVIDPHAKVYNQYNTPKHLWNVRSK